MREKYESLGVLDLKAVAKARGLKGVSLLKKAEVVELMLQADERDRLEKERLEQEKREKA
jgi:transcription termination factor Rho